jgi:hypothetical protein
MSLPVGWHAEHPAPVTSAGRTYFRTDEGGEYEIVGREDGTTDVVGLRSHVRYSSLQNRVEQTGGFRRQPGSRWGARAVLTLDTGEGLDELRGILLG